MATPGADIQWTSSWCGREGQSDQVWSSKKPILFCRTMSSFPLNEFIVTQETQSSLNWFQRSITLSQKKYFRRSSLQRCLTSLTKWPLVADRVLLSKSDSNFGLDFPINILNISSKSALFLLSSNVQRPSCFSLSLYGIPSYQVGLPFL